MRRHTLVLTLAACACLALPAASLAVSPTVAPPTVAPPPTASPPLSASEKTFVAALTSDLQRRFGSTAAATAAGYFRYTDEDDTGAISWVNTSYWKSDPQHPSQLWYDVKGRLIGADLSLPKADSASAPSLWGVSPSRWGTLIQHVHYAVKKADGSMDYSGYGPKTAAKLGLPLVGAAAADIVKYGKAKSPSEVAFVFPFPAIWDLQVWLVPNPLGPFAEHNPNVTPSKPAGGM